MKNYRNYKDYYFNGNYKNLENLNLPISIQCSGHLIYINGNGCHILISFGLLCLYEHNEPTKESNAWHREIIDILFENNLLKEIPIEKK